MKPKTYRKGDIDKSNVMDQCQTPYYALDPLLLYIDPAWVIWESAAGAGQIVNKLRQDKLQVAHSDILTGQNFFDYEPNFWQCQITNPPYSIKYDWLARSYELEKPFALLMPLEVLGAKTGQSLFEKYGIQIILLNKRVNFKMPNKGYTGTAQFPTAWFTWGLGMKENLIYGKITQYADKQMSLLDYSSTPFKPEMKQLSLEEK